MDRREAIDILVGVIATNSEEENEALDLAIEALSAERTVWIPVSERLPEELEEVLVCVTHNGKSKMAVSCRRDYNYWDVLGRDIIGEMAWMPLPKPYKGGDTE